MCTVNLSALYWHQFELLFQWQIGVWNKLNCFIIFDNWCMNQFQKKFLCFSIFIFLKIKTNLELSILGQKLTKIKCLSFLLNYWYMCTRSCQDTGICSWLVLWPCCGRYINYPIKGGILCPTPNFFPGMFTELLVHLHYLIQWLYNLFYSYWFFVN